MNSQPISSFSNFDNLKTVKIFKMFFLLEREADLEKKISFYLKNNRPIRFGSVSEVDFLRLIFTRSKDFLSSLDFVYPRTKFLNRCLNWKTGRLIRPEPIYSSRLFINLLGICFKQQYKICFVGIHFDKEQSLRRTLNFFFPKLSDLTFIHQSQIRSKLQETLLFLKKFNYQLLFFADDKKLFHNKFLTALPQQSIFFDPEAMGVYGHGNDFYKKRKKRDRGFHLKMLKLLQLPWHLFLIVGERGITLFKMVFLLFPYRIFFLLFWLLVKVDKNEINDNIFKGNE